MRQISPRARRRGFTLVEVMVVVAIIGVMSALAVFTVNGVLDASRERGAARGTAALIKRARSLAMQEHRLVDVIAAAGIVKLQSCKARYGAPACAGGAPMADVVNAQILFGGDTDAKGVTMSAFPGTTLRFLPNGFPETAGLYVYELNHPGTVAVSKVQVTAGGDVRVQ